MKNFFSVIVLIFVCGAVSAQSVTEKKVSFGVAAKASTTGFGADVYCAFGDRLGIKAGFDLMSMNFNVKIDQGLVKLNTQAQAKTGSITAGVGYQLTNWFYVTGGFGFLNFNPRALAYPTEGIKYGDIVLSPETVGELEVKIKPSNPVAPYLGIGFGRYVSKNNRVSFGAELGTWFMGSPKLEITATGMLTPTQSPEHIERLENQIKDFSFYPILKFNLNVRIFNL